MMHAACWFRLLIFFFASNQVFDSWSVNQFLCGVLNATTQPWRSILFIQLILIRQTFLARSYSTWWLYGHNYFALFRTRFLCLTTSTEHSSFVLFLFWFMCHTTVFFWHLGGLSLSLTFTLNRGVFFVSCTCNACCLVITLCLEIIMFLRHAF